MEAHPDVGVVQALPMLTGRDTLFARILQFAVRVSGPMFASGIAFWQLGERQLLGPQRDPAHETVRGALWVAATARGPAHLAARS
jgi:hypothetical protein